MKMHETQASKALRSLRSLTSLNLSSNEFGDGGARAIAKALPPALKVLRLDECIIEDRTGFAILFAAVEIDSMRTLHMQDCELLCTHIWKELQVYCYEVHDLVLVTHV